MTDKLAAKDKQYLWHPFTQMSQWDEEDPLIIEQAEGVYLIDTQGRRYIDGVSSLWCNVHGHRRPEIDRAVRKQLDRMAHSTLLGLAGVPSIRLAERLVNLAPEPLTRVFYSDSGSTAVEIALKMAFQYWQQRSEPKPEKKKFLTWTSAYHGDTIGSVSLGGMDLFHQIYKPLLFETVQVPQPFCYRCPYDLQRESCETKCADDAIETIHRHADELAAVVIEPIVYGASGIVTAPEGYLSAVRNACTKSNVLLIADEVAVGFGRTGTMFACEQEGVAPDLLCLAKGLTGGYLPLAATLATEQIYGAFLGESRRKFFHGHTYTGNALACAAALANLEIFEEQRVLANLKPMISALSEGLARFGDLLHVGEIRQRGMIAGLELVKDRDGKKPYDPARGIGHNVVLRARSKGVVIRPLGDVIVLMPPLSITFDEMKMLLNAVYDAIREETDGA